MFRGVGSACFYKLGSWAGQFPRLDWWRASDWLLREPVGTPGADVSHSLSFVCLEEKPKYISERVKLLRPSWE